MNAFTFIDSKVLQPSVYHAVYSEQAAAIYGSGVWLSTDGVTEVEVTSVDTDRGRLFHLYGWSDKVYVGTVTKRLRQGKPDPSPLPVYSPYLPLL